MDRSFRWGVGVSSYLPSMGYPSGGHIQCSSTVSVACATAFFRVVAELSRDIQRSKSQSGKFDSYLVQSQLCNPPLGRGVYPKSSLLTHPAFHVLHIYVEETAQVISGFATVGDIADARPDELDGLWF